jgi:hypothetical protein
MQSRFFSAQSTVPIKASQELEVISSTKEPTDDKVIIEADIGRITESAKLCLYSYDPKVIVDPGYILYPSESKNDVDYAGFCFLTKHPTPNDDEKMYYDVYFVHRGTVPKKVNNLIDDIAIMMGKVPLVYYAAKIFVLETLNKLKHANIRLWTVFHIGHSSGAIVADLQCLNCYEIYRQQVDHSDGSKEPDFQENHSVTFENPGSKPIAFKVAGQGDFPAKYIEQGRNLCKNFSNDVNLINCCNEQLGINYAIIPYSYNFTPSGVYPNVRNYISIDILENYYFFTYTLDQHLIENIYKQLNLPGVSFNIVNYPFGIKNCYAAYLDYDMRKAFWDSYIKLAWDWDIVERVRFFYSYKNFELYAISKIRITRKFLLNMLKSDDALLNDFVDLKARQTKVDAITSNLVTNESNIEIEGQIFALIEKDNFHSDIIPSNNAICKSFGLFGKFTEGERKENSEIEGQHIVTIADEKKLDPTTCMIM